MKIGVLGATGRTGQQLIKLALEANHEVVAVVRSPEKITDTHEKLSVIKADIFSEEDLKTHFKDVDAICSTLGFGIYPRTITGYSDVTKCAVNAMRELNCKRLIIEHSWYTNHSTRNDSPTFFVRWVLIPLIRPVLDDMRRAEEYLEANCGDINYTIVCPPGLTDGPKTDKEYNIEVNGWMVPGGSEQISRADVAQYMLQILENEESFHKIHAISVK